MCSCIFGVRYHIFHAYTSTKSDDDNAFNTVTEIESSVCFNMKLQDLTHEIFRQNPVDLTFWTIFWKIKLQRSEEMNFL